MKHPECGLEQSVSARRPSRLLFVGRHLPAGLRMACLLTAFMLAAGPGCYSRPGPPEPADGSYQGSPISLDASGSAYLIHANVGSPGYTLQLDSMWDAYRRKNVFITIRKPDPRFAYPQSLVDLSLLTQVDTTDSITVFARLAEHDEKDIDDDYRQAASAEGVKKAATGTSK